MEFPEKIKNLIDASDTKTIRAYIIGSAIALFLLLFLYAFIFYRTIGKLKTQLNAVNRRRTEATEILERYQQVKRQQATVDAILAKEKNFKISQAFEQLLDKVNIRVNKAQEPETTSQQVLDGYTEWTLYANLINLNTKKLSELLYAIEQEERIYTKEIDIEKVGNDRTINVKITIATLEQKAENQEAAER